MDCSFPCLKDLIEAGHGKCKLVVLMFFLQKGRCLELFFWNWSLNSFAVKKTGLCGICVVPSSAMHVLEQWCW